MSELVLSAEQMRLVSDSTGPIIVRTESGDVLGVIEPISPGGDQLEVAEMQARRARPHQRYSIAEVLAKLQSSSN